MTIFNLPHLTFLAGKGHGGSALLHIDLDSTSLCPALQLTVTSLFCCILLLSLDSLRIFKSVWSFFHCAVNVHCPVCHPFPKNVTEITQLLLLYFLILWSCMFIVFIVFTFILVGFHKEETIKSGGTFFWVQQNFIPLVTWKQVDFVECFKILVF